jgi:hypothetical protein
MGCRIWYNIKIDSGLFSPSSGGSVDEKIDKSVHHGQSMEKKWGALLKSSDETVENERYRFFSFQTGVVSGVYLDIAVSSIVYEITPVGNGEDGMEMSPGKFFSGFTCLE